MNAEATYRTQVLKEQTERQDRVVQYKKYHYYQMKLVMVRQGRLFLYSGEIPASSNLPLVSRTLILGTKKKSPYQWLECCRYSCVFDFEEEGNHLDCGIEKAVQMEMEPYWPALMNCVKLKIGCDTLQD